MLELAHNQEVQRKAQEEVDQVLAANDGVLDYEALQKMEYLERVIQGDGTRSLLVEEYFRVLPFFRAFLEATKLFLSFSLYNFFFCLFFSKVKRNLKFLSFFFFRDTPEVSSRAWSRTSLYKTVSDDGYSSFGKGRSSADPHVLYSEGSGNLAESRTVRSRPVHRRRKCRQTPLLVFTFW